MREPGSIEAVGWSGQVGTPWPLVHLSIIHQQWLNFCSIFAWDRLSPLSLASPYHLQCPDLLPKALMQLLEPGVGAEGG